MKKVKVLGIVLGCVIIIAILYCLLHHIYVRKRFDPFMANMEQGESSVMVDGRYRCGVSEPKDITSWRGNLYVTAVRNISAQDGYYCDLVIWAEFPKGYTILAQICDFSGNVLEEVTLDEHMELIESDDGKQNILNQYHEELQEASLAGNNAFGIPVLSVDEQ